MERKIVSATWRKASYSSGNGGNCVEAGSVPGAVVVRDTKDHERGPVLSVSPWAWRRFITGLK